MFQMFTTFFAMVSNFITGTNSFVNAYNEAGKWAEDSMRGFNSVAEQERKIRLAKLQRELDVQLQALPATIENNE